MGIKTEVIKFNVRNRGRKFLGQDRNFDAVAMCNLINSGAVQERVKMGDMFGYYSHEPRRLLGMNPEGGGFVKGKGYINIEPALVTTYLQAFPDGTVEHQAEFLDNDAGKIAQRLYSNKKGGFSSAVDSRNFSGMNKPTQFYGFDYVLEPNFATNRGHAVNLDSILDGVSEEEEEEVLSLFDAVADYNARIAYENRMLDSVTDSYNRMAEALEHALAENDELLSMLSAAGIDREKTLDAVGPVAFGGGEGKFTQSEDFLTASIAGIAAIPEDPSEVKPDTAASGKGLLGRMFF